MPPPPDSRHLWMVILTSSHHIGQHSSRGKEGKPDICFWFFVVGGEVLRLTGWEVRVFIHHNHFPEWKPERQRTLWLSLFRVGNRAVAEGKGSSHALTLTGALLVSLSCSYMSPCTCPAALGGDKDCTSHTQFSAPPRLVPSTRGSHT